MEKQPDLQPSPPLRRGSPINGMIPPRPFKKGQSGNPKGYSKKKKLLIEFRDYFEQHPEKWDAMITVAIKAAEKGEFQYWNALVERVKGKVPQENKHSGLIDIVQNESNNDAYKNRQNDIRAKK